MFSGAEEAVRATHEFGASVAWVQKLPGQICPRGPHPGREVCSPDSPPSSRCHAAHSKNHTGSISQAQ